jgi:hypothetical protein
LSLSYTGSCDGDVLVHVSVLVHVNVSVGVNVHVSVLVHVNVSVGVAVLVTVYVIVFVNVTVYVIVHVNVFVHAHVFVNVFVNVIVLTKKGTTMLQFNIKVHFPHWYIGNPYWIEMYKMIEISKNSGMNRSRATQNKRKAIEEHLKLVGMTLADYGKLEELSKRQFHVDDAGQIIIPEDRVLSFIVSTCATARSAQRPCDPEQVRSRFKVTPWSTGKTKQDGIWSRFATVTAGTGAKLSNQRGLRENAYIGDFNATGSIWFDPQFVRPDVMENAMKWGGQNVGVGASRKMGMGRFDLLEFKQV